jgi:hypothetical protein
VDKEQILNEIRRTAAANGGKLLGERSFYRETGISPSELGRHWARFSEAQKEAGFTPHKFPDAQRYSNDDLLSYYARLAQELGRLPTKGDLRLRKHREGDSANDKTYDTRFGSKLGLVGQLATYCASRPDYANVLLLCQDYIAKNREANPDEAFPEDETGYVYLMKMGRFYKIGRTNDVVRRGGEITIHLPEQATTVHFFRTDDPSGIEAYWHRRFADKRRNGEWFELTGKDIAAFKRRKSFM